MTTVERPVRPRFGVRDAAALSQELDLRAYEKYWNERFEGASPRVAAENAKLWRQEEWRKHMQALETRKKQYQRDLREYRKCQELVGP